MDFKNKYTEDEVKELVDWYEKRWDNLPQSVRLDKSTYIPDVRRSLRRYLEIASLHYRNATFAGQIYHAFLIRERMIEEAGGDIPPMASAAPAEK